MIDWKSMASAVGLSATGSDLDALVAPLQALPLAIQEAALRLAPGTEPAVIYNPEPDERLNDH